MVCHHVQLWFTYSINTCIKIHTSIMSVSVLLIQTYRIHVLNKCGQIFSLQYIYWTSLDSRLSLCLGRDHSPSAIPPCSLPSHCRLTCPGSVAWSGGLCGIAWRHPYSVHILKPGAENKSKYLRVNTNKITGIRIIYFFCHIKSLTMKLQV